jgi:hypothetical protein
MRGLQQRCAPIIASATLTLAWVGCDSSGVSSSTTEATVSGVVTVIGKPATGGQISFNPANVARKDAPTRSAEIGKDGRYTLRTLVGRNAVILFMPQVGRSADLLRARKTIEVNTGENTCDIDVPPMPKHKK